MHCKEYADGRKRMKIGYSEWQRRVLLEDQQKKDDRMHWLMYSKLFWLDTNSNELWERLLLLLAPERGIWIRTHSMGLLRNDPHKLVSLLAYTFVELDKDEKVRANNQFFE